LYYSVWSYSVLDSIVVHYSELYDLVVDDRGLYYSVLYYLVLYYSVLYDSVL